MGAQIPGVIWAPWRRRGLPQLPVTKRRGRHPPHGPMPLPMRLTHQMLAPGFGEQSEATLRRERRRENPSIRVGRRRTRIRGRNSPVRLHGGSPLQTREVRGEPRNSFLAWKRVGSTDAPREARKRRQAYYRERKAPQRRRYQKGIRRRNGPTPRNPGRERAVDQRHHPRTGSRRKRYRSSYRRYTAIRRRKRAQGPRYPETSRRRRDDPDYRSHQRQGDEADALHMSRCRSRCG